MRRVYPQFLLVLMQEIAHVSFRDFVHQQQFLHWQFGKRGQQPDVQKQEQLAKPPGATDTTR